MTTRGFPLHMCAMGVRRSWKHVISTAPDRCRNLRVISPWIDPVYAMKNAKKLSYLTRMLTGRGDPFLEACF